MDLGPGLEQGPIPLRAAVSSASFTRALSARLVFGPGSSAVPPAIIPPLNELATLRVGFVPPANLHMVMAYAALTVVQDRSVDPAVVNFDLFKQPDVGRFRHLAAPRLNRP